MMKTEEEIRRHRDDLRAAALLPCDCDRTGHSEECRIGGLAMLAAEQTLSWLLGEDDALQERVDTIHKVVAWSAEIG